MIVLRTPKGWTGPEGGRRPARSRAPGARTRCRWPSCRDDPEHLAQLEAWMRSYRPEELFDDDGALRAGDRRRWRRAGDRRMSANPHANGGAAAARPASCPTSATTPSTCRAPGARRSEATRVLGALPARRRSRRNPDELPHLRPRRDRLEPARRGLRGHRPGLGRRESRPTDEHLAPDGRVMEVLSRAPVPGLAGGLPAHRPPRPVQLLRGVHPHRRLDVQPARQVAEGHRRDPVAAPDRRRSTTCSARTSGARTTTASPTRTRASSTTSSTRRPRSSASTCRRTPTPAVGGRPLPAQPRLRQRDRGRQAAASWTA